MNKSVMSVKSMIETYVKFELSEDTWNMFLQMANHDLISYETWTNFFMKCKGWVLSDNGDAVIDFDNNDMIVYKRNEYGQLVKA